MHILKYVLSHFSGLEIITILVIPGFTYVGRESLIMNKNVVHCALFNTFYHIKQPSQTSHKSFGHLDLVI